MDRSRGGSRVARRRLYGLVALVALLAAGVWLGLSGGAAASRSIPVCKSGQKSTRTHPCIPVCKAGQRSTRAHPCARAKTLARTSTTTPGTSGGSKGSGGTGSLGGSGGGSGGVYLANGCPAGTIIPQGTYAGDGDEDNTNGGDPEDGDGCL
jgi:hypothetical protein